MSTESVTETQCADLYIILYAKIRRHANIYVQHCVELLKLVASDGSLYLPCTLSDGPMPFELQAHIRTHILSWLRLNLDGYIKYPVMGSGSYFYNYKDIFTLTPDVQVVKLHMKLSEKSIVKVFSKVCTPKCMSLSPHLHLVSAST